MGADTPYVAQTRLRFGDGFIDPGEPVPVVPGRNYSQMLSLGEIVFVGGGSAIARPHADERPHEGSQVREQTVRHARSAAASQNASTGDLRDMKRKDLDELAERLGIEDADKLSNRDAVIEAIEAKQAAE